MEKAPTFNQQNYKIELGWHDPATQTIITISQDGCAECCVAADCVASGKQTDPEQLNQALIGVSGYQNNGSGQHDELIWSDLTKIYPDMVLAFNNKYPTTPADMSLIDAQLAKGLSVIVGVSFRHNPQDQYATHYVRIYQKNPDGTYSCMDPWQGANIIFDTTYAVNGMSIAQCILQAVSFNRPVEGDTPPPAPPAPVSGEAQLNNQEDNAIEVLRQGMNSITLPDGSHFGNVEAVARAGVDAITRLKDAQKALEDAQKQVSGLQGNLLAAQQADQVDKGMIDQIQGQLVGLQAKLSNANTNATLAVAPEVVAEVSQEVSQLPTQTKVSILRAGISWLMQFLNLSK